MKTLILVLYPALTCNCPDLLTFLVDLAFCLGNCFCLTNILYFSFTEWVCGESLFIIIILITLLSWREILWVLNSFLTDNYLQHITKYDSSILYILLLPWRIKHPSLFCLLCWGNWVLPRCFKDILTTKIVSCVGACVWAHVCHAFQSAVSEWKLKTSTHDLVRHQIDSIWTLAFCVILKTSICYTMNIILGSSYTSVVCLFVHLYFSLPHILFCFPFTSYSLHSIQGSVCSKV